MKRIAYLFLSLALALAGMFLFVATSNAQIQSSTQSDLYEFETDLDGWISTMPGGVSWMTPGSDLTGRQPGSVMVLVDGASIRTTETLIEGRYHMIWDWYYTGEGFSIQINSADPSQDNILLVRSSMNCQRNGSPWEIDQWNECAADIEFVTYITSTHELTREIIFTGMAGGILDHFQISRIDVPGGNPIPTPGGPTPTPTPAPGDQWYPTEPDPAVTWFDTYRQCTPATYNNDFTFSINQPDEFSFSGTFQRCVNDNLYGEFKIVPSQALGINGKAVSFNVQSCSTALSFYLAPSICTAQSYLIQEASLPSDITEQFDYVASGVDLASDFWLFRGYTSYKWNPQAVSYHVSDIRIWEYGTPPDPDPEAPIIPTTGYTATCSIAGAPTSANLLTNSSFESSIYTDWQPGSLDWSVIGPASAYSPSLRYASDGSYSLYYPAIAPASTICQEVYIPPITSTVYLTAGLDAIASAGINSGSRNVRLTLNDVEIAAGTIAASDTNWRPISGTLSVLTGGGYTANFCIETTSATTGIYIDRAYLIVSDGSEMVCPEPAPPPDPAPTPAPTPAPILPPDNFPDPTDPAGGGCLNCLKPDNWLDFGQWIRWLLCGINNLFWCYLYLWIASLRNYILLIGDQLNILSFWLAANLNGGASFLATTLNNGADWLATLLNSTIAVIGRNLDALAGWLAGSLNALADWLAGSLNALADWLAGSLNALGWLAEDLFFAFTTWIKTGIDFGLGYAESLIATGINWLLQATADLWQWLYIQALIARSAISALLNSISAFFSIIWSMMSAIFEWFEMIGNAIIGLFEVIRSDPLTNKELFGYELLCDAGSYVPQTTKALMCLTLTGVHVSDSVFDTVPEFKAVLYMVMGGMGLLLLLWTGKQVRQYLPVS